MSNALYEEDPELAVMLIILGLGQLILGIFEAYYLGLSKYVFSEECMFVTNEIMGGCIIDLFSGICCFTCLFLIKSGKIFLQSQGFKIMYVILSVIFYYGDLQCHDEILKNTPHFWTFITIHFMSGIGILSIFAVILMAILCQYCAQFITCCRKIKYNPVTSIELA